MRRGNSSWLCVKKKKKKETQAVFVLQREKVWLFYCFLEKKKKEKRDILQEAYFFIISDFYFCHMGPNCLTIDCSRLMRCSDSLSHNVPLLASLASGPSSYK